MAARPRLTGPLAAWPCLPAANGTTTTAAAAAAAAAARLLFARPAQPTPLVQACKSCWLYLILTTLFFTPPYHCCAKYTYEAAAAAAAGFFYNVERRKRPPAPPPPATAAAGTCKRVWALAWLPLIARTPAAEGSNVMYYAANLF